MTAAAALDELGRRLWDERRIVTYLLFKLTVAKLLLSSDERRFVADALAEVDSTVELLRAGEARRDDALRDLAAVWQVDPAELTLTELARRAPVPLGHQFREHLAAFQELADEVEAITAHNRALARANIGEVRHALGLLAGTSDDATVYDASGRLGPATPVGDRLREVL